MTGGGLFINGLDAIIKNGTLRGSSASVTGNFRGESATFLRMTLHGSCIDGFDASVSVVSSVIRECPGDAVHVVSGGVSVSGSQIIHNRGTGVYGAFGGVGVSSSTVSENGDDGVFSTGQSLYLTNNLINRNAVVDISPYGVDHLYVQGNRFRNSPVLAEDTSTIVDLGGNLCAVGTAPFLPCVFP
jgi:hypothetical protein